MWVIMLKFVAISQNVAEIRHFSIFQKAAVLHLGFLQISKF